MSDTQALPPPTARDFELELHQFCSEYYADPLGWVRGAFQWGVAGPLQPYREPDTWQCEFFAWLGDEIRARKFDGVLPVLPIRGAVSSGHGVGKGAEVGMLVAFLMSTRRNAKGVITANTSTQLQDKTWAGIQTWVKRALTAHWFEINQNIMYRKGLREQWKCSPQTCDPDNSESFAGQHNVASTSFYIFDEASNIQETIFETADGGLSDGEPMMFMFGNPTRRRGMFHDTIFGQAGGRWKTWVIDARTSRFPSQEKIAQDCEDWGGEDSDRFRVRVRGIPPKAEDAQFIDSQRVLDAQKRQVVVLDDEPLVAGCDLAWGGNDNNVIRFRRGLDARSIPAIKIRGALTRDPSVLTNRLADVLGATYSGRKIAMLFLDSAGIAGSIGARLRELGHANVREINFGADSPEPTKTRYFRDYMWQAMKVWLLHGAIDKSPQLEADLTAPGIREENQQRIWLESKKEMRKRDIPSPDEADALCWVAGTMVRTPDGARAIETLRLGDLVSTPMGPRRVLRLHESETRTLTTVRLSNGQSLCGKGAHRVFEKARGFIRADALRLTFAVETDSLRERLVWWLWRHSCIAAKPSGFKVVAATISPIGRMRPSDFFIGASGLTRTDLFLTAAKSIIVTMIGRTMPLRILNCAGPASISVNICGNDSPILWSWRNSGRGKPWLSRKRPNGIAVAPDARGIESMGKRHGRGASNLAWCARDVLENFSRIFRRVCGFARGRVRNAAAISVNAPMRVSARAVVSRFSLTSIGLRATAVMAVQTVAVPATRTYNLTVEDEHVYYANGVLVENCLTFAQAVAPVRPSVPPPPPPRSAFG